MYKTCWAWYILSWIVLYSWQHTEHNASCAGTQVLNEFRPCKLALQCKSITMCTHAHAHTQTHTDTHTHTHSNTQAHLHTKAIIWRMQVGTHTHTHTQTQTQIHTKSGIVWDWKIWDIWKLRKLFDCSLHLLSMNGYIVGPCQGGFIKVGLPHWSQTPPVWCLLSGSIWSKLCHITLKWRHLHFKR